VPDFNFEIEQLRATHAHQDSELSTLVLETRPVHISTIHHPDVIIIRSPAPTHAQIDLCGFKSYKEASIAEPFSPGINVVVGANGAGKSNFFHGAKWQHPWCRKMRHVTCFCACVPV